jgi:PadR family transcriptional regulator, regulatory protein PadR
MAQAVLGSSARTRGLAGLHQARRLIGKKCWGEAVLGKPTDLVQGTLDLLILKTVALEPMHGWAIAQRIRQVSKDVLLVNQGALYPALHRLEQNGWISAHWGESENNRRAKYYSLTKAGKKYMREEEANWERLSAAIGLVLKIG